MNFSDNRKYLPLLVFSVFILCFIYALTAPISDPDLFWHLANGKWIIENRMLPDHDPFAYTTQTYAYSSYERTFFILTSYWLSQVLIYFSYLAGGYGGVLVLRILVFCGIIGMLLKWLREKGYRLLETLIFLVPVAWALLKFTGERPNQLTYLFSVIALYFIYAVKERSRKGWLLVPVMMLWANGHGGFVLGMALIGIFMLYESIDALAGRKQGRVNEGYPKAMLIYGISFFSCGINPSGFKVFKVLLELNNDYTGVVVEYMSPLKLYSATGNYPPLLIASIAAISLLVIFVLGLRKRAEDVFLSGGLFLFLGILSFQAVRYIPFLILLPVPAAASYLKPYIGRQKPFVVQMLVSFFLALFIAYLPPLAATVLRSPLINSRYPGNLVSYMKKNNIKDNMFNSAEIGGYLIWGLYPDGKVFIDTRGIVQKVFSAYLGVAQGSGEDLHGLPLWKSVLDSYKVRNIVLTPLMSNGVMYDLVDRLYGDPEWRLVYIDDVSGAMLFRNDASLPELPKILAYANILKYTRIYQRQRPENPQIYITMAKAQVMLGRKNEAVKVLEDSIIKLPAFRDQGLQQALDHIRDNRTWW